MSQKCDWCPCVDKLYKIDDLYLCRACAAEYYDLSEEEYKDIDDYPEDEYDD